MSLSETACESVAPSAVGNVRQAEEQCKRTIELLDRFETLLREANIFNRATEEPKLATGITDAPTDMSLGRTAERVNRGIRMNANRLGDLLDVMQSELT